MSTMTNTVSLLILISLLVFFNANSVAQPKEDKVILYETSVKFMYDIKADFDATAIIKDVGDNYIQIKKIVDPSNEAIKKWKSYWAVEYANNKYFNLGYSSDLNQWGTYVKFDLIGKYCAIFIDADSRKIVSGGGNLYGGDLMGVMIAGTHKWGKNWVDANGHKKKILFIDTSYMEAGMFTRNDSSPGNLLTKEKLTEIMGTAYPDIDVKTISFEKVVDIIKELNQANITEIK